MPRKISNKRYADCLKRKKYNILLREIKNLFFKKGNIYHIYGLELLIVKHSNLP